VLRPHCTNNKKSVLPKKAKRLTTRREHDEED
jgi:hypothetical protein